MANPVPVAGRRRPVVDGVTVLVVLVGANSIVPLLLKSLLSPKFRYSVGDDTVGSPIASLAQRLLALVIVAVCVFLILSRLNRPPRRGKAAVLIMLAPWVFMITRDVYLGDRPRVATFLYGLIVLTLWMLQPTLQRLSLVAGIVFVATAASLLLGALMPLAGVLSHQDGELVHPEKQMLPWGILIGLFGSGNTLALFLVIGFPAAVYVRRWQLRVLLIAMVAFASVWTSARNEILALGVGLLLIGLFKLLRPVVVPPIALLVLLLAAASTAYLPLTTTSDQAFTNRGYIWRISLTFWPQNRWLGHGTTWYSGIASFVNPLPNTAFSGHNLFVHTLVIGGLVDLIMIVLILQLLIRRAVIWSAHGTAFPTAFLAVLFVCCGQEVPFGFTDATPMLAVAVIPMAIMAFAPLPSEATGTEPVPAGPQERDEPVPAGVAAVRP